MSRYSSIRQYRWNEEYTSATHEHGAVHQPMGFIVFKQMCTGDFIATFGIAKDALKRIQYIQKRYQWTPKN